MWLSVWETLPNFRRFHNNLYQTQLLSFSAFPKSQLQSLPHPYSPLRVHTFLRISRNPGPDKQSISHKSVGMRLPSANPQPGRFSNISLGLPPALFLSVCLFLWFCVVCVYSFLYLSLCLCCERCVFCVWFLPVRWLIWFLHMCISTNIGISLLFHIRTYFLSYSSVCFFF